MSGHAVYQTMLQRLIVLSGVLASMPARRPRLPGDRGGALRVVAQVRALRRPRRPARHPGPRRGFRVHMKLASGGHLDDLDPTSFFEQGAGVRRGRRPARLGAQAAAVENRTPPVPRRPRQRAAALGRLRRLHRDPRRHLPDPRRGRRREGQRGRAGGGAQLHRGVPRHPGHPRPPPPRHRRLVGSAKGWLDETFRRGEAS